MGYDVPEQRKIETLAVCHDIGKSQIPISILRKKGPLDAAEWELMMTHSTLSYDILVSKGFSLEDAQIVRWHHESVDGTGYPDKLQGSRIPKESQIISVADYYDAVTSPRPYRNTCMTEQQALHQIRTLAGVKFRNDVVTALEAVILDVNSQPRRVQSPTRLSRLYQAAYILKGGD